MVDSQLIYINLCLLTIEEEKNAIQNVIENVPSTSGILAPTIECTMRHRTNNFKCILKKLRSSFEKVQIPTKTSVAKSNYLYGPWNTVQDIACDRSYTYRNIFQKSHLNSRSRISTLENS